MDGGIIVWFTCRSDQKAALPGSGARPEHNANLPRSGFSGVCSILVNRAVIDHLSRLDDCQPFSDRAKAFLIEKSSESVRRTRLARFIIELCAVHAFAMFRSSLSPWAVSAMSRNVFATSKSVSRNDAPTRSGSSIKKQ
jgi:hypothetical protein